MFLLHDPDSLLKVDDNNVLLPIEVIEVIERFKRESSDLGQNARAVSRMLDGFRGAGRLSEGVGLPNGGQLRIIFEKANGTTNGHTPFGNGSVDNTDSAKHAFNTKKASPKGQTVLVSKDINLRIKADALGLLARGGLRKRSRFHQGFIHRNDRGEGGPRNKITPRSGTTGSWS